MARFAELSESELSTIVKEKDAEDTKKATKVTLNIFRLSQNIVIYQWLADQLFASAFGIAK